MIPFFVGDAVLVLTLVIPFFAVDLDLVLTLVILFFAVDLDLELKFASLSFAVHAPTPVTLFFAVLELKFLTLFFVDDAVQSSV